jgi:15-cis-phytoene desaturase
MVSHPPSPIARRWDVLVVGGGLAGLTAGVALSGKGLKVLVLEKSADLGGRARTVIAAGTRDSIPIGPHVLLSEYHNMLRLLDVLGTRSKIVWQETDFITMMHGCEDVPIRSSPLPAPFQFIPSLIRDNTISHRDWISNIPITLFALSCSDSDVEALDRVPGLDLVRQFKVTERFRQHFWAFTANAILNTPLEECSAGALVRFYRRLVGQRDVRMGFPAEGLGELFAPPARHFIEARGGCVLSGANANRILVHDARAVGVALADRREFRAQHVVAALPPEALLCCAGSAVPAFTDLRKLAALRPCPYISVFLWFDRKVGSRRFWARTYSERDLNCDFYDLSNIYPHWTNRGSLVASNIIASSRLGAISDAEVVAGTLAELRQNMPGARQARLLHHAVHRIPMAIPHADVGSESCRLGAPTPIAGLVLAGDWLGTGLPASMESACFAGWRAAEIISRNLGCPETLAAPHPRMDWLAFSLGRVAAPLFRLAGTLHRLAGEAGKHRSARSAD